MSDQSGHSVKITRGLKWATVGFTVSRGLQLAATLVLGRLLAPSQFGIYSLAMVFATAVAVLRDAGIGQALILTTGAPQRVLGTGATLAVGYSAAAAILLCTGSGFAARFFGQPELAPMLWVLSACLLVYSFGAASLATLERQLRFRRRVEIEVVGYVAFASIAILGAFARLGAWAGLCGQAALSGVTALLAIRAVRAKQWWEGWDSAIARNIVGHGKYLVGAALLSFAVSNLDNAVVAKVLSVRELGMYALAYTLGAIAPTQVVGALNRVMFPGYTNVLEAQGSADFHFSVALRMVFGLTGAYACALIGLARPLVVWMLPYQWRRMIEPLQVLAIFGVVRALGATAGGYLNALRRTHVPMMSGLVHLVIVVLGLYPMTRRFGMVGAGWTVLMGVSAATVLNALAVRRHLGARGIRWAEAVGMFGAPATALAGVFVTQQASLPCRLAVVGSATVAAAILSLRNQLAAFVGRK